MLQYVLGYGVCYVTICVMLQYPNELHLLNKYQINMGFSHFNEYADLICDVHIGTISNRYCERIWFLQWQYYINFILIFFTNNHDFGRYRQH